MSAKSNKALFCCTSCMDKCAYCGKYEKNMHNNSNYAAKCQACANAYKDTVCAICGGKLDQKGHTVHRCGSCGSKSFHQCFKCGCQLK